jgi:hypothetical protein
VVPIEWFGAPRQEQFDTANQRTLELIESIRAEA